MEHQDVASELEWDLPPPDPCAFSLDNELNINKRLSCEDLRKFRDWAQQSGLPISSDSELVKFLHSCDYNLEEAQSCAEVFYDFRKSNSELFAGWDIQLPNFQSLLGVITFAILPRRTPDNYRIIFSGLRTSDTKNYVFIDVCKLMFMAIETVFVTEPTIDGVIFIYDLPDASMGHFLKFGITLPKKVATYSQGGMPLKFASTHVTRCPSFIDNGLKLIKPLVTKEDWKKLFVHRVDDHSVLHDRIPKYCLPIEVGGTLPSIQELTELTLTRLQCFKDFFYSQYDLNE